MTFRIEEPHRLDSGAEATNFVSRVGDTAVHAVQIVPDEDLDREPFLAASIFYEGSEPRDVTVQDADYWRQQDNFPVSVGHQTIWMTLVELRKLRYQLDKF